MLLVPAKWERRAPGIARWFLTVNGVTLASVWKDEGVWWSGLSFASFRTLRDAKAEVEKALNARSGR